MHDYKNKNPYEILGVTETDTTPVIERAYRNKIYLYCTMNQEAEDIYGNILKDIFTTALNILINPETRKQLDQELALKELIEQQCVDKEEKADTLLANWIGVFAEEGFKFIKIEEIQNIGDVKVSAIHLIPPHLIDENGTVSSKRLIQIEMLINQHIQENTLLKEQIKNNRGLVYTKKEM